MSGSEGRLAGVTLQGAKASGFSIYGNSPCLWPRCMAGQPGAPLRVAVVDSNAQTRGVITRELDRDSRTVVAGEGTTLRDGLRLVGDVPLDVLLVDLSLVDGDGLELVAYARSVRPRLQVVALSSDTEDDALRALQLGAAGFMVKGARFIGFVQAALQVANGGAAITPAVSRRLVMNRAENAPVPGRVAAVRAPAPATT